MGEKIRTGRAAHFSLHALDQSVADGGVGEKEQSTQEHTNK